WSKHDKGRRKRSLKLLHKLPPPPGWSLPQMRAVAIVGRYHRGALVPTSDPMFAGIPARSRRHLLQLAGILRLANALVSAAQSAELRVNASRTDGVVSISGDGIEAQIGPEGERLARSKYLLEVAAGVAIEIR